MMAKKFLILLVGLLGLAGCRSDVVLDEFKSLPDSGWKQGKKVAFDFEITDTTRYTSFFINLRITGDYPFSNLYVVSHITAPDKTVQSKRSHWVLAKDDGKWLGSGMGDILSYQLPLSENLALKKPGKYRIELEQYMRLETLPEVKDVGIFIQKGEVIF